VIQNRKIPLRKCVVTREQLPKQDLIRVVNNKELGVKVDLTGKLNGRGAYIKKDKAAILKARKSNALGRMLETTIPDEIYDELMSLFE